MDFTDAEYEIRTRFDAQFPGLQPNTVIRHDNRADSYPGPTREWVRLNTVMGVASMMEIGGSISEQIGRIIVQIFIPKGQLVTQAPVGVSRAHEVADSVAKIFQGQHFQGVTCFATEPVPVGADPGGLPFWQLNASTRFRFENTPA